MDDKRNGNVRFNITMVMIYIVGIILLIRLFNLQIVHGEEYRSESNTRLTRETTLKAARGSILDSSGNKLVSTTVEYNVEIYKTKIDADTLNKSLLLFAQTLEANGDKYVDEFPIKINPYTYVGSNFESWKKANKINESATEEEAFNYFKNRYKVSTDSLENDRRVITLRYAIELNGYSSTRSVTIAKNIGNVTRDTLNVMSENYPGISTSSKPTTQYNYGELASHILGYVGPISDSELKVNTDYDMNDYIGKAGVEKVFEKYLKGTDGIRQVDMSVEGVVTDEYVSKEAISGSDVVLTIDADLQKVTEKALADDIYNMQTGKLYGARKADQGAAVVINVKTGEILAMASYPNYNPALFTDGISTANWNNYLNDSRHPLVNKAISDISAPGSTFKMVTALAGLQSGAIGTGSYITCKGHYTHFDDYQPWCWLRGGHGAQNVTSAIEHSCNYFFYETGRLTGIKNLAGTASSLGLGQKTGIELPDEATGNLASPDTIQSGDVWTAGYTIQAAIGQLYNAFSPVQMAKYTAMIANGGRNLDVTIIKAINNPDGTQVSRNDINTYVNQKLGITGNSGSDLEISAENLNAVKQGMRGVTSDDGGTAVQYFRNFNIEVGGKTGSATTAYGTNSWFVGFAPFNDPEIAIAVYVKNGAHGAYTAPVARDIFAQYFGMNDTAITEDTTAAGEMFAVR